MIYIKTVGELRKHYENQRQCRSDRFYITANIKIETVVLEDNRYIAWKLIYSTHETLWVTSSFAEFFESIAKTKAAF